MKLQTLVLTVMVMAGGSSVAGPKAADKLDVAFVAELVDGVKVWRTIPSVISFKKGTLVHAKIINLLPEAHGFEIKDLVKPLVVNPGAQDLMFRVSQAGAQTVSCHLHPAHQPTAFTVL